MQIDKDTVADMFDILHDEIVEGGAPKIIRFMDNADVTLCDMNFDEIIEDTHIPGEFYFQDQFAVRILKAASGATGTVSQFEIYDAAMTPIISGTVTLLNAGGDIEFNALDWTIGQAIIISSLKFIFPSEN